MLTSFKDPDWGTSLEGGETGIRRNDFTQSASSLIPRAAKSVVLSEEGEKRSRSCLPNTLGTRQHLKKPTALDLAPFDPCLNGRDLEGAPRVHATGSLDLRDYDSVRGEMQPGKTPLCAKTPCMQFRPTGRGAVTGAISHPATHE